MGSGFGREDLFDKRPRGGKGFVGFKFGGGGAEEWDRRRWVSGLFGATTVVIGGGEDHETTEVDKDEDERDEFSESGS